MKRLSTIIFELGQMYSILTIDTSDLKTVMNLLMSYSMVCASAPFIGRTLSGVLLAGAIASISKWIIK